MVGMLNLLTQASFKGKKKREFQGMKVRPRLEAFVNH